MYMYTMSLSTVHVTLINENIFIVIKIIIRLYYYLYMHCISCKTWPLLSQPENFFFSKFHTKIENIGEVTPIRNINLRHFVHIFHFLYENLQQFEKKKIFWLRAAAKFCKKYIYINLIHNLLFYAVYMCSSSAYMHMHTDSTSIELITIKVISARDT